MLKPFQMLADCADGLPALQGRWCGLPAHEPVPDELELVEVLWVVSVEPSPAEAVVAPGPLVEDVPVFVVEVPLELPVEVPVLVPVEAPVVVPVEVLPVDPDDEPVVVEPVPSVVGVGLPEDSSPPALVGVGPVSPGEGLEIGGGPVLTQPGGAVGVGLFVGPEPPPAAPVPDEGVSAPVPVSPVWADPGPEAELVPVASLPS